MKSVFNTRSDLTALLACAGMLALFGCTGHPSEEDYIPTPPTVTPVQQAALKPVPQQFTSISVTYKNQASSVNVTLDPYDEDLNIQMTRSKDPAPPVAKRDTVFVAPPVQQTATVVAPAVPQPINVQVQLPPEHHDSTKTLDSLSQLQSKLAEQKNAANTDEVVGDIRHAQEYFYKQDYTSAMRLVKAAQEIRPTAEGYALQGSIHYMLNDKPSARYYWNEALKINPNLPEVTDALAKLDGAH